ncbi:MAG: CIA30 family protein [Phycisphaerales bacterium]|nr:CIA30 family protein [Phycisphaerales bacterium]
MISPIALSFVLSAATLAQPSIPELAVQSGRLDTLVTAVQTADLLETLAGEGPFTVFAPSDEAFARIDQNTLTTLLQEPGHETLRRILAHHVVAGEFDAADLVGRDSIETLAGTTLTLEVARDRLLVGDSVVESADIDASNGVVHIIDRVLLPPAPISPLKAFLDRAVERGVPLFNDGSPEGCAAVYATALEAVVSSDGWGIEDQQRRNLLGTLKETASINDPGERAWGYRRIIDSLGSNMPMGPSATSDTKSLFDFSDPREVNRWGVVVDGVMGGLSTGFVRQQDGNLSFTGETSLRNNGGFSSIRAGLPGGVLSGYDAVRIRVKGDGRTWILGVRSQSGMGGDSYWTRFETRKGEWMTVTAPISEMEHHFFGERIPGRISPRNIRGIEFYIYDKKSGPFDLEVESIEGVRGQSL